jgi:short-subunit dehydrogenase
MKLDRKVAVVTGVSKGIGLETAKYLLDKGMHVAGWSRTAPELKHPSFKHYSTDMSDFKSVEEACKKTVKDFGSEIAVLINNAGLGYEGPLEYMDVAQWKEMFDVNVHGVFFASKLIIPYMKPQDEGHIINIASLAGLNGIENMAGYCGSKFAVRGITHALFKELRNYGIKVSCIYPGSVQTSFFDSIDSVEVNENMLRPNDVAETIVNLLESHPNALHVDVEIRPLRPKGKPSKT